jgi:hypothetical protein
VTTDLLRAVVRFLRAPEYAPSACGTECPLVLRSVVQRSRILTGLGLWLLAIVLVANAPLPSSPLQVFEEERDGHEDGKTDLVEQVKSAARQEPPRQLAPRMAAHLVVHAPPRPSRPAVDATLPDPIRFSVRRLL